MFHIWRCIAYVWTIHLQVFRSRNLDFGFYEFRKPDVRFFFVSITKGVLTADTRSSFHRFRINIHNGRLSPGGSRPLPRCDDNLKLIEHRSLLRDRRRSFPLAAGKNIQCDGNVTGIAGIVYGGGRSSPGKGCPEKRDEFLISI